MFEKIDVYWSGWFSVVLMFDWMDRYCCYFLCLFFCNMLLYIEMVIIGVIIYGKGDYLVYSEEEYLVVL